MATSTPRQRRKQKLPESVELARICARAADARKGEEIIILDLRKLTYITDFFIIVTAGNPRQMDAIATAIGEEMKPRGQRILGAEGIGQSRWVLLDYGDLVVHIFSHEWRRLYDLELLWGDAPRIEWQETRG